MDLEQEAKKFKKEFLGDENAIGYWNYRYFEKIIKLTDKEKEDISKFYKELRNDENYDCSDLLKDDVEYDLREVYYNDKDEIVAWSEQPIHIWADNLKDLKFLLKKAKSATKRNTIIEIGDKVVDSGRKMKRTWKK